MAARPVPEGIVVGSDRTRRCWWGAEPPVYQEYHDTEWGVPVTDDFRLFEKICLEGFQSGLSWLTILKKREAFREVFCGFDFNQVAWFGDLETTVMLEDARIVRHRGKIASTINNARRAIETVAEFGSLAGYFWHWEPAAKSRPRKLDKAALMTLATTPESTALSKDLRKRGWTFVGPTTCYAFMQGVGLVNDHLEGCPARARVTAARRAAKIVPVPPKRG
jgi:DNA-3-methyladenine glycosylase I